MKTPKERIRCEAQRPGFTRVDFLAVVSGIMLFIFLSVPGLSRWRAVNATTLCLRNHRQLTTAWLLYAADNGSFLCNNFTIPGTENTVQSAKFATWANNIMTWGVSGFDDRSSTNVALARRGVLAPFSSDPVGMIKCPSDNFLSAAQRRQGWKARVRSVSMNGLMGHFDSSSGGLTGHGWDPNFRQFFRLEDIPRPENAWVTTDEHADSINDGFFIIDYNAVQWGDVPGSYHNGAGTFGFADGHGEVHPWLSSKTKLPVRFSFISTTFDVLARKDFAWFRERTSFVPFQ